MRKILAFMLALALVFSFTSCGGGEDAGSGGEKTAKEQSEDAVISIGGCKAEYKGYEITKGYDGEDALIVTYSFTNNSEEAESFEWAFVNKLFQDGKELKYCTVFVSEDSYDTVDESMATEIKPGNTIEVKTAHALYNLESPVEVDFEGMISDDKDSFEIDITK